jgi:NTP pyrophosphatase (non-canonical NTP hydrolase)
MKFTELKSAIHANALKKGFWENKEINLKLSLIISELYEALEAHRNNFYYGKPIKSIENFESEIKDTVEDEIADVAIRLLDLAGYKDIDLKTKFKDTTKIENEFHENVLRLNDMLLQLNINSITDYLEIFSYLDKWAEQLNFNLESHILAKVEYNINRPYLHGKRF